MGRLIHGPVLTTALVVGSLWEKPWDETFRKGWVEFPLKFDVKVLPFFFMLFIIGSIYGRFTCILIILLIFYVKCWQIYHAWILYGYDVCFICFGCPKGCLGID